MTFAYRTVFVVIERGRQVSISSARLLALPHMRFVVIGTLTRQICHDARLLRYALHTVLIPLVPSSPSTLLYNVLYTHSVQCIMYVVHPKSK
jgi:hypothetical protein